MRRVYLETYGCQMNVQDSELLLGILAGDDYEQTAEPHDADVMLVNTCAVRDNAEQRVLGRVGWLKQYKRPGTVLGVLGCMAQRLGPRLLEETPYVDLVVGPDAYRSLPELISRARDGARAAETSLRGWEHYEDVPAVRAPGPRAFVTVQRGCDYRCTFCIVPMTRGPERSRSLAQVVDEVRRLADAGTTEVTLLGQTVNSYHDGTHDFADLLRAVGAVGGIRRMRFTSPHPNDFSERVIAALAEVPAACEHVHLPAQSGSNAVLRRMLRRFDRFAYLDVVRRLREAVPNLAITTDLIVGFPGETDGDFAATLSLVREVGFDDAFTFRFSPREGTPATRLRDAVPSAVAAQRLETLIEVVREVARARNAALVGSTHEVLLEEPARRGELVLGRTRTNKVVLLCLPQDRIGRYEQVLLTGTTGSTFTGTVVSGGLAVVG
jgi:tRNA-2-methylthio-N6-dimethylallyladenosine synthase